MTLALWLLAVTALAFVGTGAMRQYALSRALVDQPNARGSHRVATPRGGGVGIVIATVAGMLAAPGWLSASVEPAGVLLAATGVAAVGFVDDHGHVPPAIRLTLHLACAVTAVWALPRLSPLSLGPVALTHGWIGLSFAVVLLAWYLNFTNFMDGIDGIAAVQTICVCAGACVLAASVSAPAPLGAAALAAACLGFLLWNWPPAKIFMGDAGSGFVGFLTGVLTLEYGGVTPALGWPMIILSGVFAVDATVTLCIRAARREPVLQAHRSHAYQMLAARWRRHGPVTMLVAAINVFWLTPIACAVAWGWLSPMAGLALGWLPLVVGVVWVNRTAAAGERVG